MPPVISLVALPRLWLPDMAVLIKAVAIDNADGKAPRRPGDPTGHWAWPRGGEFSHGLRCGEFVFVGAQSAKGRRGAIAHGGDIVSQAKLTISNISEVLNTLGCDLDDVVKLNNYLTDLKYLPTFRQVRDSYLADANRPASTTIAISGLAREGALLEIEAVAVLPLAKAKSASKGKSARRTTKPARSKRR